MKKILGFFGIAILLLGAYFAFGNREDVVTIFKDKFGWFRSEEEIKMLENEKRARQYAEDMKNWMVFVGERLYYPYVDENNNTQTPKLIKGKLLDNQYADIFNKIEDTVLIDYQDQFYFAKNNLDPYHSDARFVFAGRVDVDSTVIKDTDNEYELNKIYAKLVYEGKAEGYRIAPEKYAAKKYLYPYKDFNNKFSDYFFSTRMKHIPLEIKEVLLNEFLLTEDGKKFNWTEDKRDYRELIHRYDPTGDDIDGLAIVLADKELNNKGETKEVLLIVVYDPDKQEYVMTYKHFFYDKVRIKLVIFNKEDNTYEPGHSEDLPDGQYFGLLVIQPGETDHVLLYDKEFDMMKVFPIRELPKIE